MRLCDSCGEHPAMVDLDYCKVCIEDAMGELGQDVEQDLREDNFRDDVDADADVLRSAGYGTDEDYGFYGDDGGYDF